MATRILSSRTPRAFLLSLTLGALLVGCGGGGVVRSHFMRGVDAQDEGDAHGAIAAYEQALMDAPDDVRVHYNMALIYHDLQRSERAAGHSEAAEEREQQARRQYNRVLEISPANMPAVLGLAQLRADGGSLTEASELLLAAEAGNETDQRLLVLARAQLARRRGDVSQYRVLLLEVLEGDPSSARAASSLALLLIGDGKHADAEQVLAPALAVHRYDLGLLMVSARIALLQAQTFEKLRMNGGGSTTAASELSSEEVAAWENAALRMSKVLALSPHYWRALHGLATVLEGQGHLGGAVATFWQARRNASAKALRLEGEDPALWHRRVQDRLKKLYELLPEWEASLTLPTAESPRNSP